MLQGTLITPFQISCGMDHIRYALDQRDAGNPPTSTRKRGGAQSLGRIFSQAEESKCVSEILLEHYSLLLNASVMLRIT
jgi:hypothetical protein